MRNQCRNGCPNPNNHTIECNRKFIEALQSFANPGDEE